MTCAAYDAGITNKSNFETTNICIQGYSRVSKTIQRSDFNLNNYLGYVTPQKYISSGTIRGQGFSQQRDIS